VSLSRITSGINAYQGNDNQAGFGQLRKGFRHLLQSINDGHLENAQQAFNNLSQTLPVVFDKVSVKLIHDYDSIGSALDVGDISGAQKAVVQLKNDIQDIGRAENLSGRDPNMAGARNSAVAANTIIRSYYSGNIERDHYIGTHIDIIV
jgi:soluble cytochrome b562